MTNRPILAARSVSVTISSRSGDVSAASGVSFTIHAGRTLAIVGESGSGKTMTAMSLVGLTPAGTAVATTGSADLLGQDLLALSEKELRQVRGGSVGVVFQDPSAALNPLMSTGEQIAEAVPASVRGGKRRERVAELIAEVGLGSVPGMVRRYPHELSGGQQQRVAIAIALAGNPRLLIADEPTTALDVNVQAQIMALLRRLQQGRNMAMLLISHDLGLVASFSDDLIVLRGGEIVEQGPTLQVLNAPASDYTRALLASRPRLRTASPAPTIQPAAAGRAEGSGSSAQGTLLAVSDLLVSYPGRGILAKPVLAVDRVSLEVAKGDALGLVGESGSGKSTIAKAIVGLVGVRSGTICFEGRPLGDPTRMGRAQRARLQYIFQDAFGALNPRMTVEQAIGEPLAIGGHRRADRQKLAAKLLDEVGMSAGHLDRLPRELSGGQRQRVTIARALALSPALLICDEIVSALDVSVQAQVIDLLKQLQRDRALSLLFISHDLAVVSQICRRVAVLRAGRIVEEGDAAKVFSEPASAYTQSLVEAAASLEGGLPPPMKRQAA